MALLLLSYSEREKYAQVVSPTSANVANNRYYIRTLTPLSRECRDNNKLT
jgi:hypothetical protein